MQPLTYPQALQRMTALCSRAEYCEADIRQKLRTSGLSTDDTDRLIDYLFDENYINTPRYAHAFVRDKFRHAQWGRLKIAQALRMKRVPESDIRAAMDDEMADDDYQALLTQLLAKKAASLHTSQTGLPQEDSNIHARLIRFALSRGFTMDEALAAAGNLK